MELQCGSMWMHNTGCTWTENRTRGAASSLVTLKRCTAGPPIEWLRFSLFDFFTF